MLTSDEIRSTFINFFEKKKHSYAVPSPVVPESDPTLLFINAGMNQFKDVFLGHKKPDTPRAVNSQPCIRVSGKHNDLEDVGFDFTHLTFFEMLGNWSFGDYYKKEAISWAWELFTELFKIDKSKLVATVFQDDAESLTLWQTQTDINHHQIVKCDEKDNFWEMGATGPCGPCSEIHVYLKPGPMPYPLTQDIINNGDFIELWNLVFIAFDRKASGKLIPLADQHVDTGAGLERLVAYLQGTASNYDTDLFKPIIKQIEQLSKIPYTQTAKGMPHRVCADHIRTLCFGIADNVILSNEGRGYVLRRLLRRACRYAKQLGFEEPVLYKLVDSVVVSLGKTYPIIKQRQDYIKQVVKAEEASFLETLQQGLLRFEDIVHQLKQDKQTIISGEAAFKLYDTYGFPLDLTAVLAKENKLQVDVDAFEECLNQQRERSRSAAKFNQQQQPKQSNVVADLFKDCKLHLAEDLNIAKGGEARIIADPVEKVNMACHHSATHILHHCLRQELGEHIQQAGSLVDSNRLRFDFSHFEKLSDQQLKAIEQKANDMIQAKLPVNVNITTLESAKNQGAIALFGEKYDPSRVRVVDIGSQSIECCAGTHVQNTSQIECVKILTETAISAGNRRLEAVAGVKTISQVLNQDIEKLTPQLNILKEQFDHALSTEKSTSENQVVYKQLNQLINQKNPTDLKQKQHYLNQLKIMVVDAKKVIKSLKKATAKAPSSQQKELVKQLIEAKKKLTQTTNYIVSQQAISDINVMRQVSDQCVAQDTSVIVALLSNTQGQLIVKCSKHNQHINAAKIIKDVTQKYGGGGGGRPDMAQAGGLPIKDSTEILDFITSLITTHA